MNQIEGSIEDSPWPGRFIYLAPTILTIVIVLIYSIFEKGTTAPYARWILWTFLSISIPISFVINRLAKQSARWASNSRFWSMALLGGVLWAWLLSLGFGMIAAVVNHSIGLGERTVPSDANSLKLIWYGSMRAVPVFSLVLVPIHLVYSIFRRKIESKILASA